MPSATNTHTPSVIFDRCVDAARPLKVICVGAGISGILAAINLPQQVQNLDLTIYDKNEELGGTWFENKYPGCACGELYRFMVAGKHTLIAHQTYPLIAISYPSKQTPHGLHSTLKPRRSLNTGRNWRTSMTAGNT